MLRENLMDGVIFHLFSFLTLMFIGGCAGSTTCGIKIFRIQILYLFIVNQLKKIIYPKGVFIIKYDKNSVDDKFMASIISFIFLYLVIFFLINCIFIFKWFRFCYFDFRCGHFNIKCWSWIGLYNWPQWQFFKFTRNF